MEIVAYGSFNLDLAIDYTFGNWRQKQDSIAAAQIAAEQEASKWLISQFQSELDDCLDRQFQTALNMQTLPISDLSVFSVVAHFEYKDVIFYLRRINFSDTLQWELSYTSNRIICLPEYLKTQILIELGKIKNSKTLQIAPNENKS
ncbi:hypothetical protein NIES4075_44600 [Tolypothrix sp. NIES-4075]|uniref:hypothetical protein n=1 Tax=Tolypothrix sp. NIES-4075 TaxID=2005459 RepID=UPI000B5C8A45|nr:hypothetical protein [Tolypothrix sp. NIES-4075]GAX43447.1 hypothetical protein NIES4075_44600 [Tolypothrix sp. NIES-4075]